MIIGLIGAPDAGKDTVADFFVNYKEFKRLAFADKIKEGYYLETGFTEEQFKQSRGTPLEHIIRDGLWKYSAKVCAERGPRYFIWKILEEINDCNKSIVVTDVRTSLELSALEKYNTKLILILRNFKEELKGKILPGTKLELNKIIDYQKFWNISNNLDETYIELENFYKELQEIE